MGGVLIERWPRSYWWQLMPWLLSHTRCWPVNISWGLCAAQRAIFKRLGQKRIWEHRPVIQGGTRIIFSTAKIKLGDWAGTEISAATFCARLLCSSHQTFHGMKKKMKQGRKGEAVAQETMSCLCANPVQNAKKACRRYEATERLPSWLLCTWRQTDVYTTAPQRALYDSETTFTCSDSNIQKKTVTSAHFYLTCHPIKSEQRWTWYDQIFELILARCCIYWR